MAFANKKQYEYLIKTEKGKDLIEKIGELKQNDFLDAFSKLIEENKEDINNYKEENQDTDINE